MQKKTYQPRQFSISKIIDDLKTGRKLFIGFLISCLMMVIIGIIGFSGLQSMNQTIESMYTDRLIPITDLGVVDSELYNISSETNKMIAVPLEKKTSIDKVRTSIETINSHIDHYAMSKLSSGEAMELENFKASWASYLELVNEFIGYVENSQDIGSIPMIVEGGRLAAARETVSGSMKNLVSLNSDLANNYRKSAQSTYTQAWILIVLFNLGGVVFSVFTGVLIARSINKPIGIMTRALNKLKVGIISHDTDEKTKAILLARKDEMGSALNALVKTEDYIIEASGVADQIANFDLTGSIDPKCDEDQLGNSLKRMISGLRGTIALVADTATQVNQSAQQLSSAANDAGTATDQIAMTMQQVAAGTAQQSESVNKTASVIDQLSRIVEGVSNGADEQAAAIVKASGITDELTSSFEQVSKNAKAVVENSSFAIEAARNGSSIVQQTLSGMESIKNTVGQSAKKVQEMGQRSDQIGNIVTTIEDIASQTNLLALNAAIEAARAGDAGKGFAVVADEVRKLAERSSSSTKEIADLIKGIQKTVAEAVQAMDQGAQEVQKGVVFANQAGDALNKILIAAEDVNNQAEQSADAAQQMSASANELISAVDSVSAVVEQNTAATKEMTTQSMEVTSAIENIASVSEENSASVEEVSASAEEMSAQVNQVNFSAKELSRLSTKLEEVVSQFKV